MTADRITSMIDVYRTVVDRYVATMPDIRYLAGTLSERDSFLDTLPNEIEINYQLYLDSLEAPMPFFLGTPEITGDSLEFSWGEAYDLDAQDVTYRLEISLDWEFRDNILHSLETMIPTVQIDLLGEGAYFWRVTATNEDGFSQIAFDTYYDAERRRHGGISLFYITAEGQVLEE
jgi:spore coat protein H